MCHSVIEVEYIRLFLLRQSTLLTEGLELLQDQAANVFDIVAAFYPAVAGVGQYDSYHRKSHLPDHYEVTFSTIYDD